MKLKPNFLPRIRCRGSVSVLTVGTLFAVAFSSCLSEQFNQQADSSKSAAEVFNYETSVKTPLSIVVKDMQDKPVAGVVIDVYYENPFDESGSVLKDGVDKVVSVFTAKDGAISTNLNVPGHISELYLVTKYPGYANPTVVATSKSGVSLTMHPAGYGVASLKSQVVAFAPTKVISNNNIFNSEDNIFKLGGYSSTGLPDYRESVRDVLNQDFKDRITTSLPEFQNVPLKKPEFLQGSARCNLKVIENNTQIWVTFVSEGAAWKNSLGYFYYPTGSAPASISAIQKRILIFPNSSFSGAGGSLAEGDKVQLLYCDGNGTWTDRFPAGVTVSWFLISDGFNTPNITVNNVTTPRPIFQGSYWNYSITAFNDDKQQNILLYDKSEKKLVISFEDTRLPAGDKDYNDALFYASYNPLTGVDVTEIAETKEAADCDKDGILDVYDTDPCDVERSKTTTTEGSLAFEDNWPAKGDYDFNDLVTDYSFVNKTNASGLVKDIDATFTIRAAGAMLHNGFAFQLNTTPDNIESVTGSQLFGSLFSLTNGVENNQTKAVIPVVDNIYSLFGASMVNTEEGGVTKPEQTIHIKITLKTPVDLGNAPYNPFLIVNQDRGREVHLPAHLPTDLANHALFGTGDDKTNPATVATCYKANQSYPWALNISAKSFAYPVEKSNIDQTHLKFSTWVTSLGTQFSDWYQSKANYRKAEKIYSK